MINEGLTVMNGPVYRYDGSSGDNSRRWPEYWDGRWFLHNSGGPSVKHALMLDPLTAARVEERQRALGGVAAEDRDLDDVGERDPEHVAQQVAEEIGDVVVDRAVLHAGYVRQRN